VKGFTLDDERIKAGRTIGDDYFDELLARIRDIRASQRLFYQKITNRPKSTPTPSLKTTTGTATRWPTPPTPPSTKPSNESRTRRQKGRGRLDGEKRSKKAANHGAANESGWFSIVCAASRSAAVFDLSQSAVGNPVSGAESVILRGTRKELVSGIDFRLLNA